MKENKFPKKEIIKHDETELLLKGKGLSQMMTRQKCCNCNFSLATVNYSSKPMMTIREIKDCEDCGHEEENYYYLH